MTVGRGWARLSGMLSKLEVGCTSLPLSNQYSLASCKRGNSRPAYHLSHPCCTVYGTRRPVKRLGSRCNDGAHVQDGDAPL
eukprot:6900604-Prymnesium_polylepis.2